MSSSDLWLLVHLTAVNLDVLHLVASTVMVTSSAGCSVLETLTLVSLIFSVAPIIFWAER